MDMKEAIRERHSVRAFTDQKIDGETEAQLREAIEECNKESGLHIQLCLNEPNAFQASQPHYGKFQNCRNYFAVVAKPGDDEKCGYYGEKLVLLAQTLGLNTCWVALTYKKKEAVYQCDPGERLRIVIAVGYGQTQGTPHRSKYVGRLYTCMDGLEDWSEEGMEYALMAPTAINQQSFRFRVQDDEVSAWAKPTLAGNTKIDLGIVKLHFEIGAGKENFHWV